MSTTEATQALAMRHAPVIPGPAELKSMLTLAQSLVQSGLLPPAIKTPQAALALIQFGRELGLGPWQAINGIHIIQQKPCASPQLMLALIHRSGELTGIDIVDTGATCTVTMKRGQLEPHAEAFSMDDARDQGLIGKSNWKAMPKIMRKWRAVAACARVVFPDVIAGLYTPEEMGAEVRATADGDMEVVQANGDAPALKVGNAPTEAVAAGPPEIGGRIAEMVQQGFEYMEAIGATFSVQKGPDGAGGEVTLETPLAVEERKRRFLKWVERGASDEQIAAKLDDLRRELHEQSAPEAVAQGKSHTSGNRDAILQQELG